MKSSETLSLSNSHTFLFTAQGYESNSKNFLSSLFMMLFSEANSNMKEKLIHLINKQI